MAASFLLAETRVKGPIFSGKLRAKKLVSAAGEALATNAIHNRLAMAVPITLVVRRIFIRPTNLPQNDARHGGAVKSDDVPSGISTLESAGGTQFK